ncbi:class I SAM-dependent methyltransferase [Flavobacterium johnsoniae]|uniref:Ubiquinone/menaquinone biosynthesis C-methylase UbiE n=1 Tax=Flavobacterium johnsoniae TaxID=986 RepID=A0A1M5L0J0_FLAJO|nr:class I SAM-dependent methyltransferase [Flavobacterium johnsoniae]SHG58511.1 Ubiquinone/menaquinone biosynthesis C-methylase UbiE [Flavobacterium johnsoniae]
MKIENKNFWEKKEVIATQEVVVSISNFEQFMFENAKNRYSSFGQIKDIKVFGCGTGRELKGIASYFEPSEIMASDISENMIGKCKENLKTWNIDDLVVTVVGDAKDYNKVNNKFQLVTILNSMLTYVPVKKDRLTIFKNAHQILVPDGVIIGTVHNQVGTMPKTVYFKLRNLFSFFLGEKTGNRDTGFKGFKVAGYYYTKKGLISDLKQTGFRDIEVYSIEDYYALDGRKYDRSKGYNNLIFVASK